MKVLALVGSPVKNGNTSRLIGALEKELRKTGVRDMKIRTIQLGEETIHPCRSCRRCLRKGRCVIRSDDFRRIARKMIRSDLIILGSPVYFHDVTGQVKNLIDRTYSLWHRRRLRGKRIIPVAVCAESGGDRAVETLQIWAQAQEMKIIRSVTGRGLRPGEVLKDEEAMEGVRKTILALAGETGQPAE